MFEKGFFDDLFDFDGEGELDGIEQAADFGLFMSMMDDEEDDDDTDMDEFDFDEE